MSKSQANVESLREAADKDDRSRNRDLPLYATPRPPSRLSHDKESTPLSQTHRGSTADLFALAANRLGYGPRPGQKAEWNAAGGTEENKYDAYLNQQLDPAGITDSDYENRKSSAGFNTLDKSLNELWMDYRIDEPSATDSDWPQEEAELDWFLRSIYSKRQLEQVMTEFWIDHFNIYSREFPTYVFWSHWVKTLRNNAFGNFRTLLGETSEHPAMLYYLDQYTSTSGGPNENYCRELFELHTMGAENYVGLVPPGDVPGDNSDGVWSAYENQGLMPTVFPNGIPDGYVDTDIFEATQSFAGYTYDSSTSTSSNPVQSEWGTYFFENSFHNPNVSAVILNFGAIRITSGTPNSQRAPIVLDMLAYHPGTARHLCRKLIRRFVQDDPPESLVISAADVFMSHHESSDQIKQVLLHILQSPEYKSSFGLKLKRPFDVVVSMLRATQGHLPWVLGDGNTNNFMYRFERTGHRPFRWRPPDGYPDVREKWQTASPRVMTWRLGQWLSYITNGSGGPFYIPVNSRTPGSVDRTPNALTDYWLSRIFARSMSSSFREEIVDFLGQGFNPDNPMNLDDSETEQRLQAMIALIMATPEFSER